MSFFGTDDGDPTARIAQHFDLCVVKFGKRLGRENFLGRSRCDPTVGDIHDAIKDRQKRIDVVRDQERGNAARTHDMLYKLDELGFATDVEIGERLVEKQ